MATVSVPDCDLCSCIYDPNFTIIYMFLDKFADACGIIKPSINELALMLDNNEEVVPALQEIHIKLLRKIKRMVPYGKWENSLTKFVHTYSNQDAWEIERFGYKNVHTAVKLRTLKALMETQFDRNVKFKAHVNGISAEKLRGEPVGSDRFGNIYWCIMDKQCNIRILRENADDETWCIVASDRDELEYLIATLKSSKNNICSNQDISEDNRRTCTLFCSDKDGVQHRQVLNCKANKKDKSGNMSNNSTNNDSNGEALLESEEKITDFNTASHELPTKTSAVNTENESNFVSEAIEEPLVMINGEGSGSNCETCPTFSEVIEECTFYVYGLGNGEENGMGNVKLSDNSTCNSPQLKNPKETKLHITSTDNTDSLAMNASITTSVKNSVELPPKKKIPKGYIFNPNFNESSKCTDIVHATESENRERPNNDCQGLTKANEIPDEESVQVSSKMTTATSRDHLNRRIENSGINFGISSLPNKELHSNAVDGKFINMHESDISTHGKIEGYRRTEHEYTDEVNNVAEVKSSNEIFSAVRVNYNKTEEMGEIIPHETEEPVDCFRSAIFNDRKKSNKKSRRSKTGIVDGLDISHILVDKTDGLLPVRQSRRIAQQKIREETNRRLIEEKMLREMKAEAMKKKNVEMSQTEDDDYVLPNDEDFRNTEYIKIKKKRNDKPWLTSTSESSSESELDDDYIEPERSEDPPSSYKSDHEFSPESDIENEFITPVKRARTVRGENEYISNENDSCFNHDCQKCGKTDHPEWILLCDSCDKGYHCSCLIPVLFIIPEGDWFCPSCQHEKLIMNLQTKLSQHDEYCKQRRSDETHEKNAKANNYDSDSKCVQVVKKKTYESNFVFEDFDSEHFSEKETEYNSSTSSREKSTHDHDDLSEIEHEDISTYRLRRRRQNNLNYRFNEYDDLIDSAIHSNTTTHDAKWHVNAGKEIQENKHEAVISPSKSPSAGKKSKRNKETTKKKKRLNNLDVSSDDDCGSDEDFTHEQSTSDEEDESVSMTEESESSLECLKSSMFRAVSKRKLDMEFIDDDSDKSIYNIRPRNNRANKILDESDEFEEEDLTESEDIDSEQLCNDTETDSSEDRKIKKRTGIRKDSLKRNVKISSKRKRTVIKTNSIKDDQKSINNQTIIKESDSDASVDEKSLNMKRRTRGRKLHYILDDDFQSSDDGITPGVQRPDTPPEERERFIQKQEEIKRMLAEKNTAAAKELATPKNIPFSETTEKNQLTLSIVPPQIIENAKVLDIDFLKSAKNADSDDFDDDLAANFPDSDEVNEEDLAKIMEDEDFAQHHLRQSDEEPLRSKSLFIDSPNKKKTRDFDSIDPDKITTSEKKFTPLENAIKSLKNNPGNIKITSTTDTIDRFLQNKPSGSRNALPEPSLSYHHQLLPLPTSSLLQEMKQQAIPLQDCQDSVQFDSSLILASGADMITPPPVHMFPSTTLNIPVNKIEPLQSKDSIPIMRRRRRKKITPLRGDLDRIMENRACEQSMNCLSPNVDNNVSINYNLQTCYNNSSNIYPPAFISSESKLDQTDTPPTNCNAPLNFPRDFPMSPLNEHRIFRAFQNLEPVDRESATTEQVTDITESIQSDHISPESTSEFSGLVSYFSSQQNELNA